MDQSSATQTTWYLALIQGTTAVPMAFAKLISTVGDQLGLFLEPTHIRRKGQAEADAQVADAKAKAEIAIIKVENKLAIQNIQDRAEERVRKREEKRQSNLEAIVGKAANELPEAVSDQPVDNDWIAQFFSNCQDVSNEQMQTVWARILAGEVSKPGTFSLRTLTVVRVMSKTDAELFTRFCSSVWLTSDGLEPIVPDLEPMLAFPDMNLNLTDLVRLDSLGLIRFEGVGGFVHQFTSGAELRWVYYGRIHLLSKKESGEIRMGRALLTEVGKELFPIAGSNPNELYRSWVVSRIRNMGWEVEEVGSSATDQTSPT